MKIIISKLFSIFIAALIVFGMINLSNPVVAQAPDQSLEKVENKVLDALSTEGTSNYVIEMAEKADLSKAYSIKDWSERGWYVYNTLREVAARTQKPIIEILEKQGVKYESFFAGNEIAVYGSGISTLTEISSLKAVDHVRFPRTAHIDPGFSVSSEMTVPQASINALDWGITDTNADDFWSAFGLQGDGLIVANIDTGVQWDHPALDQSFKCGTNPSDPACWADPSNICGGSACDNNGHGTHTMGTMVGDDDPSLTYQVGMAPNAQWIACKGCESTTCSDYALNTCADWILAPGGNPANRPHIVNNSWGGGGGDTWYLTNVQSWRAAGIFPAFSAGNSGPGCGTLGDPGDYQESFATASHMSSRTISEFSSRGPSAVFGDDPYTKPNISAPGSSITSSFPGDGYASISGTSMAAPHVAGAVALLWSCNSSLIGEMTATFELLQDTADPPNDAGNCSAPADGEGNYTYGYGYLNVLAAGQQVCAAGTIAGTVTDGTNSVEGATVTADNGAGLSIDTLTLANGTYSLSLTSGTYTVSATKYGHSGDTQTGVVVTEGNTANVNFMITPLSTSLVSGYVYDGGVAGVGAHGYPLYSSIQITAPGFYQTIYTDPFTGYYEIDLLDSATYIFEVQAVPQGYSTLSEDVTPTGTTYSKDFALMVGPSCSAPGYQSDYDIFYSFEGTNGGFTVSGATSWAWGVPNSGPGEAHSGDFVWATNLNGEYNADEDGYLTSPSIDLTYFGVGIPVIEWYQWLQSESGYDFASLQVTKDGGTTWTNIYGEISGTIDQSWTKHSVKLDSSYNVSNFQIRFHFRSDFTMAYPGWYVDDIGIIAAPPPTTVFSTNFDSDNGGFVASGANSS